MKHSTEKVREKKNKLPEVFIIMGAAGAVGVTAVLSVIAAGYLASVLCIGTGLLLAAYGKR